MSDSEKMWDSMDTQYDYGHNNPFVLFSGITTDGTEHYWTEDTHPTREAALTQTMEWLKTKTIMVPSEMEFFSTALEPELHVAALAYRDAVQAGMAPALAKQLGETVRNETLSILEGHYARDELGGVFVRSRVIHPEGDWLPIAHRVFEVE